MSTDRTITVDAIEAQRDTEGRYAVRAAIEMLFDSNVDSSSITFTRSGPGVVVQTSINNGASWDSVESGAEIPGLNSGARVIDGKVSVRALFDPRQPVKASVSNITVTIDYESTETDEGPTAPPALVKTWNTVADFDNGTYVNTRVHNLGASGASVSPVDSHVLAFIGATEDDQPHAHYYQTSPVPVDERTVEEEQGLQVSRGNRYLDGIAEIQFHDKNTTEEDLQAIYRKAAMGFEAWVYLPSGSVYGTETRTIIEWSTEWGVIRADFGDDIPQGANLIVIPDDNEEDAVLSIRAFDYTSFTDGLESLSARIKKVYDRWMHIAFSYDGINATLYVDAIAVGSTRFTKNTEKDVGLVIPTDGNVFLGNGRLLNTALGGYMSHVGIYKRALALGNIHDHRSAPVNDDEVAALEADAGLVAHYPSTLEAAGPGGTGHVSDISSNGFDFSLRAGARVVSYTESWQGARIPPELTEQLPSPEIVLSSRATGNYWESELISIKDSTNALRFSTCPFDFTWDSKLFVGVGVLGSISEIEEDAGVNPTGLSVTLSGVNTQLMSIAWNTDVMNRPIRVYLIYVDMDATDEGDRIVGDPVEAFSGLMDELSGDVSPRDEETGIVPMSLTVSAHSDLRDWERSRSLRWTDLSQQRRYPGDLGFALLAFTTKFQIWWPNIFPMGVSGPREDSAA